MKRLVCTFLVIFAVSCTSVKDSPVAEDPSVTQEPSPILSELEYYLIWNPKGDLYVHHYDKIIPVKDRTLIMDDRVIVTPTGKVFMADGRKFQMKEGKKMYLSGSRAGQMDKEPTARR